MSYKENPATPKLLALLESRYALRVLWALRDGHPQTFRLLQDSVGTITPNTLNTRLKDLRGAGFISHDSSGYRLTPSGIDLLKRLNDLHAFAIKWVAAQNQQAEAKAAAAAATAPVEAPASAALASSSPHPTASS